MKTAEEMNLELQLVFAKLKSGEIKYKDAAELTNCVGKMIGLAKVQLEYHALRKEKPTLTFFSNGEQNEK
jgi:hypothetical protein